MSDTYFRYDGIRYAGGVDEWGDPIRGDGRSDIVLREFPVIKETPKGVWIDATWRGRKFIRTNALRHWACWSKEAALDSFIARKKKQKAILRTQLEHIQDYIRIAESQLSEDDFCRMLRLDMQESSDAA